MNFSLPGEWSRVTAEPFNSWTQNFTEVYCDKILDGQMVKKHTLLGLLGKNTDKEGMARETPQFSNTIDMVTTVC